MTHRSGSRTAARRQLVGEAWQAPACSSGSVLGSMLYVGVACALCTQRGVSFGWVAVVHCRAVSLDLASKLAELGFRPAA